MGVRASTGASAVCRSHSSLLRPHHRKLRRYRRQSSAACRSRSAPHTRQGPRLPRPRRSLLRQKQKVPPHREVGRRWRLGRRHASSHVFAIPIDPGEHRVCAEWQVPPTIATRATNGTLRFTAVAGRTYYFRSINLYQPHNIHQASVVLDPTTGDDGSLLAKQSGRANWTPQR